MKKGIGLYLRNAAVIALSCLLFSSLGGCSRSDNEKTVLCDDENTFYPEIVAKILPSHTVVRNQGKQLLFFSLDGGKEVEAFDAQAASALGDGIVRYWYPHYLATVVIAVDRDKTAAGIEGWSDLPAAKEAVGLADRVPDLQLLMAAMAYGLEGEDFTLKRAADLLEALKAEKHLAQKPFDAPIMICYDYQAATLRRNGRNIEIIVPKEGTLTYKKGLLSNTKLVFAGDVEALLLSSGFRLLDGSCDASLYPAAQAYENAATMTNFAHLNTVCQEVTRIYRRDVQHVRLYTSADGREHQLFVLLYTALVVIWTASLVRRAMQKSVKQAALFIGMLLLGWITLRLIKYQMILTTIITRYLWYGYYLFQLALPLMLLWLAWLLNKADEPKTPPKWFWFLAAGSGVLFALILTNDFHNLVFRLDLNNPHWPSEYGYGVGFYFVLAACILPLISAVVMMLVKSRRAPRKKGFLFPLAFCALLLIYGFGYVTRVPLAWESDYTMVIGLFTMLFLESSVRSGMVPVNTKYAGLFAHSPLQMQIVDRAGRPALSSATEEPVDGKLLQSALASHPLPVERDQDTLFFVAAITGGYGLWQEDIGNLRRLQEELADSVAKLAAANAVLAKEAKIRRLLSQENAKTRLLEQLEEEIAGHVESLSVLIEALEQEAEPARASARIALLLCYLKGRCNLFFRERETGTLSAAELTAYMTELVELASYSGLGIIVTNEIKTALSLRHATLFYDLFYAVSDWGTRIDCRTMLAHWGVEKESIVMRLLPSEDARSFPLETSLERAIVSAGGVFFCKDLGEAAGISLFFPEGGEEDG